jgi:hypothetical protein
MRKRFSALIYALTFAMLVGLAGIPAEVSDVGQSEVSLVQSEHPADAVQATTAERERSAAIVLDEGDMQRATDAKQLAELSAYMAWPATTNARARPEHRCRTV